MTNIVITYVGGTAVPVVEGRVDDSHPFAPCIQAKLGDEVVLTAWVKLSGFGASIAIGRIGAIGAVEEGSDVVLNEILTRYGVRRMEATVKELISREAEPENRSDVWALNQDDVPALLALWPLMNDKVCEYQKQDGRDLYCLIPSVGDETAAYSLDGHRAGPTSRALCRSCTLPDTDILCSNLIHPKTLGTATMGAFSRDLATVICDIESPDLGDSTGCQPGRNQCWRRAIEAESVPLEAISPLSLAESFDVLDALWRLAFGKSKKLVKLTTVSTPATLSLDCSSRTEFESRLSALADVLDKLTVDASLLPNNLSDEDKPKGSMDGLEICLTTQLPAQYHQSIKNAVRTLRRIRTVRHVIQHGIATDGGLTGALRVLGIHDAPPNWAGAWDAIRTHAVNALTALRNDLRQWIDSTP